MGDGLKLPTLRRLQELASGLCSVDDFVNKMIDRELGVHCPHLTQELYVKAPTDSRGYLDLDATVDMLNRLRKGKVDRDAIMVCEDCLLVKRMKN